MSGWSGSRWRSPSAIRRPGGALLAGFAFGGGLAAVFHWIGQGLPHRRRVQRPHHVGLLRAHPVGLGAIQLAQEPDGILALVGTQTAGSSREGSAPTASRPKPLTVTEAAVRRARVGRGGRAGAGSDEPAATAARSSASATDGQVTAAAAPEASRRRSGSRRRRRATATWRSSTASTCASSAAQVVALLGANGAGKSTLCAVAAGLRRTRRRHGCSSTAPTSPPRRRYTGRAAGMLLVPEARGIFPGLTVEENLDGAAARPAEREGATSASRSCERAAQAGRRPALRWRAADAEPRAGARRPADRAHRRRADARARAARVARR